MKLRKIYLMLIVVLAVALVTGSVTAKKPFTEVETVIWELTKTEVVESGIIDEMEEGLFVTGYTLEAKAKAKGGNVIPEGYFRLKLDAFSPYQDMEGQKAGFWYVQGHWTVTNKDGDEKELKVKHNPGKMEGILIAELPSDPTTGEGNWTGLAAIPMALAAGQWSRGEGSLTFRENMDGDLFLPLERWPAIQ